MTADPWPWPGDSPLDRARRVARSYRDALRHADPALCARLDHHSRALGQHWIVPRPLDHEPDDLLDAHAVADMCDVQINTVRVWHSRGLRAITTPDGQRFRVGDVLDYHQQRRYRRAGHS